MFVFLYQFDPLLLGSLDDDESRVELVDLLGTSTVPFDHRVQRPAIDHLSEAADRVAYGVAGTEEVLRIELTAHRA